jgi:hypothetical protein
VAAVPSASAPPGSLADALQGIWRELPGLISDRVVLLSLELRRAGQALARIVMLIVAVAILGVTAWVALWGCVVGALAALGVHWVLALLAVLLLNLAGAALAVSRMHALAVHLQLPATLRHLTLPPAAPVSPVSTESADAAATPPRQTAAS